MSVDVVAISIRGNRSRESSVSEMEAGALISRAGRERPTAGVVVLSAPGECRDSRKTWVKVGASQEGFLFCGATAVASAGAAGEGCVYRKGRAGKSTP
jgi:hypothetical protein